MFLSTQHAYNQIQTQLQWLARQFTSFRYLAWNVINTNNVDEIIILRTWVSFLLALTRLNASNSEMVFNQYTHCLRVSAAWLSPKAMPKTPVLCFLTEFSLSHRLLVFNHFMSTQYHGEPWEALPRFCFYFVVHSPDWFVFRGLTEPLAYRLFPLHVWYRSM